MTGLEIAAIIAMVAGTAMQQYSQYSANKAAQKQLNQAMYQLDKDGKKITDVIDESAQDFEHDKRAAQQQELAQKVSDEIKGNVAESQALRNESQSVQGNVSNDYLTAREAANDKTMAASNAFADLVGKIRSAAQLRQIEGIGLMKTGQKVDQYARDARGNWQVGQARVNDALHSKDGLMAAGQIVSALGAAMGMGAGFAGNAAQAGTSSIPASMQTQAIPTTVSGSTVSTMPFDNNYWNLIDTGRGGISAFPTFG